MKIREIIYTLDTVSFEVKYLKISNLLREAVDEIEKKSEMTFRKMVKMKIK